MSNFSLNFAAMFRDSLIKIKQFLLIFQILRKTQQYRALELLPPHIRSKIYRRWLAESESIFFLKNEDTFELAAIGFSHKPGFGNSADF